MPEFIKGLSLRFYRGIGAERQTMNGFKTFNFFIGANNSGKSTVLNFIKSYSPFNKKQTQTNDPYELLDRHQGSASGNIAFELAHSKKAIVSNFDSKVDAIAGLRDEISVLIDKITDSKTDAVWIKRQDGSTTDWEFSRILNSEQLNSIISGSTWYNLWQKIYRGSSGGSLNQHWMPETLQYIQQAIKVQIPSAHIIPAIRHIDRREGAFSDLNGAGLITRLAEIQSPDHDKRYEFKIFEKINSFLQSVIDKSDAKIEVPHNREHVLVHIDGKVLPLYSLGTGIHEVIMIASFCTLHTRSIICIEEPEIHLHPILQRKLIRYLKDFTDNQYFIATHSASLIDTPDASVFHVINDGDQTYITGTTLNSQRVQICRDLGYKSSDILQSNAVIWVEGPSDRIYINHWIKYSDPELIEGVHYSIMFYGGRLLSHLSADSEEVAAFISLRALNQNLAIVIDSDREKPQSKLNETKLRIQTEFSKGHSICWITKGREIENYVDHSKLQVAVKECNPEIYDRPSSGGQYDHPLYFIRSKAKKGELDATQKTVDKVAVARLVAEAPADLTILDLKERVQSIVKMIRDANHL